MALLSLHPRTLVWATVGLAAVVAGVWVVAKYWRIVLGIVLFGAFAVLVKIAFALLQHWLS